MSLHTLTVMFVIYFLKRHQDDLLVLLFLGPSLLMLRALLIMLLFPSLRLLSFAVKLLFEHVFLLFYSLSIAFFLYKKLFFHLIVLRTVLLLLHLQLFAIVPYFLCIFVR